MTLSTRSIFTLTLAAGCALFTPVRAAMPSNPLSVHVLDLQTGEPTAGIAVTLEQRSGNDWRQLSNAVTDAQGRVTALYPQGQRLTGGSYRIVFRTGDHYARLGKPSFFPQIPVEFNVDATDRHYHVPLLLSPFGYSTYRGN
ncbi:hydroxyisourate hydrolase [Pseudoduganella chitinolytica]|uniref:5-hydroxyisourate hydrolase n=1 Tax=Pseudoduganella chitinolytica TaxID=34070 RepID=A0ABY8BG52_9BURK|nr:hydroxyisourate hydrolase [Pseudoduganella chitinolytica]WEF34343.1 hydroxyisourate hydrolase [Pseudoduganella chitinolytica]